MVPTIEYNGGHSGTPANQRWDQVPGRSQRLLLCLYKSDKLLNVSPSDYTTFAVSGKVWIPCIRLSKPFWLAFLQLTVISLPSVVLLSKLLVAYVCCHLAFPARGSTQVLLCLFLGVLRLWHFLYSVGLHPASSLYIYTFVVSRAFMAGAASQTGDADSSRAPGRTSGSWMSTVVLYCWCHSDSASVLLKASVVGLSHISSIFYFHYRYRQLSDIYM